MDRELERITRLLVSTLIAPIIANSPLADHYESFIKTRIRFVFGGNDYAMSLRYWGNDGLMALFFFILGLEIKRELRQQHAGLAERHQKTDEQRRRTECSQQPG